MNRLSDKAIQMIAGDYSLRYSDIRLACYDADKLGLNGIILMPGHIETAKNMHPRSNLIAVSGYPAGVQPYTSKTVEISEAVNLGADEIFLVPMSGLVLDDQWDDVRTELSEAKRAAGDKPITLMMEYAVFDESHSRKLCLTAKECGYKGIATSAGFPFNSIFSVSDPLALATLVCTTEPAYVRNIRSWVGRDMEITAVDADLCLDKCAALLDAGADRVASPSMTEILK